MILLLVTFIITIKRKIYKNTSKHCSRLKGCIYNNTTNSSVCGVKIQFLFYRPSNLNSLHVSQVSVNRKATVPDKVSVVVIKNITTELSPILTKCFRSCIKREMFPKSVEVVSWLPFFSRMLVNIHLHCNITPLASLVHHQEYDKETTKAPIYLIAS